MVNNMRLFKTLVKKCFRDFIGNIKQFISIIFIIGISVTLYVGLDANYESIQKRVDQVYSQEYGNLADIWLTFNPNINDFSNNSLENEQTKIHEIIGEESNLETRLMMPSMLGDKVSNALIYYSLPNINKPYNLEFQSSNVSNNLEDFFYVDKAFIDFHNQYNEEKIGIGDEIDVSFDTSYFQNFEPIITDFITENYDVIVNYLESTLESTSEQISSIIEFLKTNKTDILETITLQISNIFSNNSISFPVEITGIMNHPENVQNGEFNTTYFLMGSKTLFTSIVSFIGNNFTYDNLVKLINENVNDEALKLVLLAYIETNAETIENYRKMIISYFQYSIFEAQDNDLSNLLKRLYNQYIIKLDNNQDLKEIENNLTSYFNNKNSEENATQSQLMAILDKDNYPSCFVLENDINQAKQMCLTFPIIFFVVAILVVLTTITQMILKERTQIGTMKALGIPKWKILFYYISLFSIVSLIGIALGFIIGPLLIPQVMNIKYELLYELPKITYVFPTLSSLITLFGILIMVALITVIIIFKELSISPTQSMRPKTPNIRIKKRKTSNIKSTSIMMALRNIRVHFTKSIMVIIGVMGCSGLLICGFGIEDTLNYGVDVDIHNILGADLTTTYTSNPNAGEMKEVLESVEGIESVYEFASLQTTASFDDKSSNEMIYYFSKETPNFGYTSWDTTTTLDNGSIIYNCGLSKAIADEIGINEGETLSILFNNNLYEFNVSKIFYTFAARGIFIYSETIELVNYRNSNWINVIKDEDGNWARSEEDLKEEIMTLDGISSIYSYKDNLNRVESYMSSIRYMTNTVKVFALLLAVVVLINLSILNYQERLRDLATLKVLGFSQKEIALSLIIESMILTFIGCLLGMAIGLPLEIMVLGANKTRLVAWSYTIYWYTFLLSFVISIIVSLVVNILISLRIKKIQMSESLKSIE